MKKMVILAAIFALVAGAVFAQADDAEGWNVGFEGKASLDITYFTKASGETKPSVGDTVDHYPYNKGSFNLVNGTRAWSPGFGLLLKLGHTGENHEVYFEMDFANVLKALATRDFDISTEEGGGIYGDDQVSIGNLLYSGFGDWYLQGNAGIIDAYLGNTGYRGLVPTYSHLYNDFLNDPMKLEDFGVLKPGSKDDNDNGMHLQKSNNMGWIEDESIAFGATFGDFKVAVGNNVGAGIASYADGRASASSVNAGLMISGQNVADMLTFDFFYAIAGNDPETNERGIPGTPSGTWDNILGIYADLALVDDIGISVGYTANFQVDEAWHYWAEGSSNYGDQTKSAAGKTSHPIYSGISLNFNYAALENVDVTWNNNVSFAGAKGIKPTDKVVGGIWAGRLVEKQSESWFAFHTALAGTYTVSDELAFTAQLANKMGSYGYKNTDGDGLESSNVINEFRAAVSAEYTVNYFTFGAGLNMGIGSASNTVKTKNTDVSKGSIFTLGLPVYFKVAF